MLEAINLLFTLVFCFELAVKIFGFGPWTFVSGVGSGMNIFDTIIVLAGVVEFAPGVRATQCYFNYFEAYILQSPLYIVTLIQQIY